MGKTSGAKALKQAKNETLPTNSVPLTGVIQCKREDTKVKHWVKINLQFKEKHDDKDVPQTVFSLIKGGQQVRGGGLANGKAEATDLEGGLYEISFPEIDAAEWEPA